MNISRNITTRERQLLQVFQSFFLSAKTVLLLLLQRCPSKGCIPSCSTIHPQGGLVFFALKLSTTFSGTFTTIFSVSMGFPFICLLPYCGRYGKLACLYLFFHLSFIPLSQVLPNSAHPFLSSYLSLNYMSIVSFTITRECTAVRSVTPSNETGRTLVSTLMYQVRA